MGMIGLVRRAEALETKAHAKSHAPLGPYPGNVCRAPLSREPRRQGPPRPLMARARIRCVAKLGGGLFGQLCRGSGFSPRCVAFKCPPPDFGRQIKQNAFTASHCRKSLVKVMNLFLKRTRRNPSFAGLWPRRGRQPMKAIGSSGTRNLLTGACAVLRPPSGAYGVNDPPWGHHVWSPDRPGDSEGLKPATPVQQCRPVGAQSHSVVKNVR